MPMESASPFQISVEHGIRRLDPALLAMMDTSSTLQANASQTPTQRFLPPIPSAKSGTAPAYVSAAQTEPISTNKEFVFLLITTAIPGTHFQVIA